MVTAAFILGAALYVPRLLEGDTLPATPMLDQTGAAYILGKPQADTTIVSFFYTHCPDNTLCPAIIGKFAWLASHLSASDHVQLVTITLDPLRDTVPVLASYARENGIQGKSQHLVCTTPELTRNLIARFGLRTRSLSWFPIYHTEMVAILDQQGKLLKRTDGANWNPENILAEATTSDASIASIFKRIRAELDSQASARCGEPKQFYPTVAKVLFCILLIGGFTYRRFINEMYKSTSAK